MAEETTKTVGDDNEGKVITPEKKGGEPPKADAPVVAPITDDIFLAEANKRLGTNFKKIDEVKLAEAQLTPEEKLKVSSKKEQRLIDKHLSKGGTVESYAALKHIASADPKEFSLTDIQFELKKGGFSEAEIAQILKERYYQFSKEEIAELSVKDEAIFKKAELFTKKLESHGSYKIKEAQSLLKSLETEVEAEDYVSKVDAKLSSTVEEIANTMERKLTIELGESNGQKLNPVVFELTDADLAEVNDILKDKTKREQFLFNEDGTENIRNIYDALLSKKVLAAVAKKAHLQGATEQVDFFRTKFPDNPIFLATGAAGSEAKAAEIGKTIPGSSRTRVRTQRP